MENVPLTGRVKNGKAQKVDPNPTGLNRIKHGNQGSGTSTNTQEVNAQVMDMLIVQSIKDQEVCREEVVKTHDTVPKAEMNTGATNRNPVEAAPPQIIEKSGANIRDRITKVMLSTNKGRARKDLKDLEVQEGKHRHPYCPNTLDTYTK